MAKWEWAAMWKRAARRWRRQALLLERDNDHQRAIASQVPYLKECVKELEETVFVWEIACCALYYGQD